MYGTFNTSIKTAYGKYTYTQSGIVYVVHIFKTDPNTMGVAGAVSTSLVNLSVLNPNSNVCTANKVIAKTNANYLDTQTGGRAFHGIFYSGGLFSIENRIGIAPDDPYVSNFLYNENFHRFSPSFCLNSLKRTASIRWPNYYTYPKTIKPVELIKQYDTIIGGQHCLVHNGYPVYEDSSAYPNGEPFSFEGLTIAKWNDLSNVYYHHNEQLGGLNSKARRSRTLFGHMVGGACLLVCVEGDKDWGESGNHGMDLKVASRMMSDLGCDYAINMDGGSPTQMRVAAGYGASNAGVVYSTISRYDIGSAICVYLK